MHTPTADIAARSRLDVRTLAPSDRDAAVLATFGGLAVGESVELVDGQDLQPLFFMLRSEAPGGFGWHCIEAGPKVWRIRITRLATW